MPVLHQRRPAQHGMTSLTDPWSGCSPSLPVRSSECWRNPGPSRGAANPHSIPFGAPVWQTGVLPDGSNPIALSSPNVANLPGGPAVVVGDEAGIRLHLQPGHRGQGVDLQRRRPGELEPVGGGGHREAHSTRSSSARVTRPIRPRVATRPSAPAAVTSGSCSESNPGTDRTAHNGVQASLAVGEPPGGHRRDGGLPGTGPGRAQRRQRLNARADSRGSKPTATSPPRRWPTCTATGRPRSSKAATRPPAWPTARPMPTAGTCGS